MQITELVESILTSPKGREILANVPETYYEGYVALWLFQILGLELDLFQNQLSEIDNQKVIQTADWSLPFWEALYGLPLGDSLSTEVRRQKVLNAMRIIAPMPPTKLKDLISEIGNGVVVDIEENTSKNTFDVNLGLPINVDLNEIRQLIEQAKPAHLLYNLGVLNKSTFNLGGAVEVIKFTSIQCGEVEAVCGGFSVGEVVTNE